MNDRFRFRVYDKSEECYVDPDECELFFIEPNGAITIGVYYGDIEETRLCKQENLCIEQCTGLKDKNGQLIYEGDIVKQDDKVFIVKWSDEDVASCGCCIPRFSGVGFICENSFQRGDLDRDIEVIGNIHENADLLEAKNEN